MLELASEVVNRVLSISYYDHNKVKPFSYQVKCCSITQSPRSLTRSASSLFIGIICKILAGSEQKVFFAHDSILLKCPDFKAIIEEDWEYGQPRIFIEDWGEDSVRRLIEWLYTGDYSAPYPGTWITSPQAGGLALSAATQIFGGSTPQTERPAELVHPPTPSNDLQSNNQDLFHRRSQGDEFVRWYKKTLLNVPPT